jgi:hypothetical protein
MIQKVPALAWRTGSIASHLKITGYSGRFFGVKGLLRDAADCAALKQIGLLFWGAVVLSLDPLIVALTAF